MAWPDASPHIAEMTERVFEEHGYHANLTWLHIHNENLPISLKHLSNLLLVWILWCFLFLIFVENEKNV